MVSLRSAKKKLKWLYAAKRIVMCFVVAVIMEASRIGDLRAVTDSLSSSLLILVRPHRGSGGEEGPSALNSPSYVTYTPRDIVLPDDAPIGFVISAFPSVRVDTLFDQDYLSPATECTVHLCDTQGELTTALSAVAADTTATKHVIVLASGVVFTRFTLPVKQGDQKTVYTYILGQKLYEGTLGIAEGERITEAALSGEAIVRTTTSESAIETDQTGSDIGDASYYRLAGFKTEWTGASGINYGIVKFGEPGYFQTSAETTAHHLILDRVWIDSDPDASSGCARGVSMQANYAAVVDCRITNITGKGFDTQAIAGWNCGGPWKIVNNYMEATGENFLTGGADPAFSTQPNNVEFRRNWLFKPVAWHAVAAYTVKNLFEMKVGNFYIVEGNIFENNWGDGQTGFGILLTIRNQGGTYDDATIRDLTMRWNVLKRSGSGINFLGGVLTGEASPTLPMKRVVIQHLLMCEMNDSDTFQNDEGKGIIGSWPQGQDNSDILIDHVTLHYHESAQSRNSFETHDYTQGGYVTRYCLTNCCSMTTSFSYGGDAPYTLHSTNQAGGVIVAGYAHHHNAFTAQYGSDDGSPEGGHLNIAVASDEELDLDPVTYRPGVGSPARGSATDGGDLGCNLETGTDLQVATSDVAA